MKNRIIFGIKITYLFLILLIGSISCEKISTQVPPFLNSVVKNVKEEYAPDSRIELFDIQLKKNGDKLIVLGEVTNSNIHKILIDSLTRFEPHQGQ